MLGEQLKKKRIELGLTQQQLSEKTGIKKNTISNYENNVSAPNEEILILLMRALSCDANYLFEDYIIQKNDYFTSDEKKHIEKYRALDEHGKKILDFILDAEYSRCANPENNKEFKVKTIAAMGGFEQVIVKDEEKLNAAIDEAFKKQNNN